MFNNKCFGSSCFAHSSLNVTKTIPGLCYTKPKNFLLFCSVVSVSLPDIQKFIYIYLHIYIMYKQQVAIVVYSLLCIVIYKIFYECS